MKILHKTAGFFALTAILFSNTYAGELNSKMEGSVKRLVKETDAKELSGLGLAVFPFQTDDALAKKRVDFAVSELFMEEFHKTGKFKLIERSQLDAVLKEQKLGLSGAVDTETAARIGKVLGARLLLIGSVSKMGKAYQISARLVDAETAEIIAPDIIEVPVNVFDEEAARYIVLVPEKEALALYIAGRYAKISESVSGPQTRFGATVTPLSAKDMSSLAPGLGVRYWPGPRWMIDFTFWPNSYWAQSDFSTSDGVCTTKVVVTQMRLLLHRRYQMRQNIRFLLGAGANGSEIETEWPAENKMLPGSVSVGRTQSDNHKTIITGIIRAGAEWRPSQRIGLGLFGDFAVGDREYEQIAEFKQQPSGDTEKAVLRKYSIPAFTIEAALSVNF